MPILLDYPYLLLKPLLFRIEPERAHRLMLAMLRHGLPLGRHHDPPALQTSVFGLSFSNPVGLAAGLDKDALALSAWQSLGFGFVEIGTVTPRPQPGNPPPRIWRLDRERALVNRMGFPSAGIEQVRSRLAHFRAVSHRMRVGVNLGPNRDTPEDRVPRDYAESIKRVAGLCDFLVINVSSPNTPGLRSFQSPERIAAIVQATRSASAELATEHPLLIKLAPELEPHLIAEICAVALELELSGIVATNTSLDHPALGVVSPFQGGLSGEPLEQRSRAMIATIYQLSQGRIPIIGVGGIASAESAYKHIRAGASLVELYTALIYRGPGLVARIKSGLVELLTRDGLRNIAEAVGRGDT